MRMGRREESEELHNEPLLSHYQRQTHHRPPPGMDDLDIIPYGSVSGRFQEDPLAAAKIQFICLTILLILLMTMVIAGGMLFIVVLVTDRGEYDSVSQPNYDYFSERVLVSMSDGVAISLTLMRPYTVSTNIFTEIFPAVLQISNQRKDDLSLRHEYDKLVFFARRGYVFVSMDIRGTGGSGGILEPQPHSPQEQDDVSEVIAWLMMQEWCSGKIGLYGTGYSAEAALIMSLRKPWDTNLSGTAAVYVTHGSVNLFRDGVPMMDGGFRFDQETIRMDHQTGLPQYPDYLDDPDFLENTDYIMTRFETPPFLASYLEHQTNDDFWRHGSVMFHYKNLTLPVYAVSGLYHPYRDFAFEIHEFAAYSEKKKISFGPWNQTAPFQSRLSPTYNDLQEGIRWFDLWLKNKFTTIQDEPEVTIFIPRQEGQSRTDDHVSGTWHFLEWPPVDSTTFNFCPGGILTTTPCTRNTTRAWTFQPEIGVGMGRWWGELHDDQTELDSHSVFFSSGNLLSDMLVVGKPVIRLSFIATSEEMRFFVRLEDVSTGGEVIHVTGAMLNANLYSDPVKPKALVLGNRYDMELSLRRTSFTFQKSHRVRVAITAGLFPMSWAPAVPSDMSILAGPGRTSIRLPQVSQQVVSEFDDVPSFTTIGFSMATDHFETDEGGSYEAGALPRNEWLETNLMVGPIMGNMASATWDWYLNINNTLLANYEGYSCFQSSAETFLTECMGYAVTTVVYNISKSLPPAASFPFCTDTPSTGLSDLGIDEEALELNTTLLSIPYLEGVPNDFLFPTPPNPIDLTCSDLPLFDMNDHLWFELRTFVQVISSQTDFILEFHRMLKVNNEVFRDYVYNQTIPRQG
mmetsp:Transcript_7266/g.20617  ORF Transcript_7266/g.20617 Transcript_7266/m.20617 type:complete len:854 (+) Transcript_7266:150-2711(+)